MAEVLPVYTVPYLHQLTAEAILMRLDSSNLEKLLQVAKRIYKLTFKRMTWDNNTQGYTTLIDEGTIGTYKSISDSEAARVAHLDNINNTWWNTHLTRIGTTPEDIPWLSGNTKDGEKIIIKFTLDSSDANGGYGEQEVSYLTEPLLRFDS